MIRWPALFVTAMCLTFAACAREQAPSYDLVIANGRVMDPESGLDAVRHVGIRGGKIEAVSDDAAHGRRASSTRRATSSRPASSTSTSTASRRSRTA